MPTRLTTRLFRTMLRLTAAAGLLTLSACALPDFGGMANILKDPAGETAVEGVSSEQDEAAEKTEVPSVGMPAVLGSALSTSFRELSAADLESEDRDGLILFTSTAEQPFTELLVEEQGSPRADGQLWAVTPDGTQAGRISPDDLGGALLPSPRSGVLTRVLGYGFTFQHPDVEVVAAPEACIDSQPSCGGFQFSPDGRFLSYLAGNDDCGRTLTVIDRASQGVVRTFPNTRWAYFTQNSTLVLAAGACDSATIQAGMYVPHTDTYAGSGLDGEAYWNPSRTAVLIQTHDPATARDALWGFNLNTGRIFIWMNDVSLVENAPTWADDEHFIFGHRKVRYDKTVESLVLEGPLQIVSMSAETRSQRLLAYDGVHDYHLCMQEGVPCQEWYGEWLQVKRAPYQPLVIKADPLTGKLEDKPAARCAFYGYDCEKPAELMALNWKTGQLLPWDEAGLPELPDQPAAPAPDFNAAPVYADPNAEFALYPGLDGRSLWRVPTSGDPEQLVSDGQNFVYLP